ncbi:MAG TPA: glycosyltransferase family 39 protein [Terriglobales bacterium]|nr:glycosyltransferase family 39 protein [Terriglobales bacterium]
MQKRSLWTDLGTLAAFCAFFFVFGAGAIGLAGADEPRYAQIAREMLARGEWIVPILNGQPWLEKPILYYWEAMLAYRLFGVSELAARLPSAISAAVMVFGVYLFVRGEAVWRSEGELQRSDSPSGMDAALMTASTVAVIGFAHGAGTDMLLAANFTLGMLAWMAWRRHEKRTWLAAFYFFMALGMLAKGPVAPGLAAIIIVIFAVLRRERRLVWRTLWLPGIALFCAVALPWYSAVQARTGTFFRVFFLEHNLERFGTDLYRHSQPFWYYVPVLLLCLAPWTVFAVAAMVDAVKRRRAGAPAAPQAEAARDPELLLFVWALVPVVFFSLSKSKLPGYILPAVPGWTMFMALRVERWGRESGRGRTGVLALHAALCAALVVLAIAAPYAAVTRGHVVVRPPMLALMVVAAIIVWSGVFFTLRAQGLRMLRFATLAAVVVALAVVVRWAGPAIDATQSARPVARELTNIDQGAKSIAVLHVRRQVEYGLNFYRNAKIASYDRAEIPPGEHLLVAREGSQPELDILLAGRRVSHVGEYLPQGLEFYWIGPPGSAAHQH